jgi:uncharacterized membrane protein
MAEIKQDEKRNELYESIKPNGSSKLYAAAVYILFPVIAIILGLLLKDNPGASLLGVLIAGWYISAYVKDLFIGIHCIAAILFYFGIQVIGILLVLLLALTAGPAAVLLAGGALGILYFIGSIILAINAVLGNKIRLPIATNNILDRFLKEDMAEPRKEKLGKK